MFCICLSIQPCVHTLSIPDQPLEHVLVHLVLCHGPCAEHVTEHAVVGYAGEAVDVVVRTPREERVEESFIV